MQADMSRDSFDPLRAFSRVISQQGRLTLDADLNELQSIQLHLLRTLARDLIGPYGGEGFQVDSATSPVPRNFAITKGRYYVDGFLCENRGEVYYRGNGSAATRTAQPYLSVAPQSLLELADNRQYLAYLDVWERHVSFAETDGRLETERLYPPLLREVALGGPDTASRAQVVWQVKVDELTEKDRGVVLSLGAQGPGLNQLQLKATIIGGGSPALSWGSDTVSVATVSNSGVVTGVSSGKAKITVTVVGTGVSDSINVQVIGVAPSVVEDATAADLRKQVLGFVRWSERVGAWEPAARGSLRAEASRSGMEDPKEPCVVAPTARYRGLENQLYRVEVHNGGTVGKATFKWSRENASVVFGVSSIAGPLVKLSNWWRDARLGIGRGDLVEVLDDDVTLHQKATPLCRVLDVDQDARTVTLDATPDVKGDNPGKHPIIRRWDHRGSAGKSSDLGTLESDGALKIEESNSDWITLEDGVRVQFVPTATPPNHVYQTGDYWLIPARTALADVVWHREGGKSVAEPPRGIDHHFAPLAIVALDGSGKVDRLFDLRRVIPAPA